MTDQPVLSHWGKLTTLLAQAKIATDPISQDLTSSIYSLINELEAESRDLLEEANLSIYQLQNVQAQLEKQTFSHQATCTENERLQREHTAAQQESRLLLLQLHQTQEELEAQYCRLNELEHQLKEQRGKLNWNRGELYACKQNHEQTQKRLSWARRKLQATEQDLKDQTGKLSFSKQQLQAVQQKLKDANWELGCNRRKLEDAEQKLEQATRKLNWHRRRLGFWKSSIKNSQKINRRLFILATRLARSISAQQARKTAGFLGYRSIPGRASTWLTSHAATPKNSNRARQE